LVGGNGNNILYGGKGLDIALFIGTLNDYTISVQKSPIGVITSNFLVSNELVVKNVHTGETNILRSIELLKIGG
jgi:ABC-type sulfate transport system permease component